MEKKNQPTESAKTQETAKATLSTLPEVKSMLQSEVEAGHVILITGLSGTGKSYLSLKLMTNERTWILAEDYGENVNGQWLLKVPEERFDAAWIMSGMGHNIETEFRRFVEHKLKQKRPPVGVVLAYCFPDPEVYQQANALKAEADTPHKSYFAAQAKLTPTAMQRALERNMGAFYNRLSAFCGSHGLSFKEYIIRNEYNGQPITKAWHERGGEVKGKGGTHE